MIKKEYNLIQSYVLRKYCVSTAYRQSSACVNSPPWYFETIIWEWDENKKESGRMLNVVTSGFNKKALDTHFGICKSLAYPGKDKND